MTTKSKIALGLSLGVVMLSAATQRLEARSGGGPECGYGGFISIGCPCGEEQTNECEIYAWNNGCGHVNYQGCFNSEVVCAF